MPTIPYKTAYSKHDRVYCDSGTIYEPIYEYEINKYGQKELVKTGETNVYEKIQSFAEECKIENILKRVSAGDTSILRPDGIYEDISQFPKSMLEARQQIQKLENLWYKLPSETKQKYNNNLEEFITKSGTKDWLIDMGLAEKNIPKEEIKENKTESEVKPNE